jgi:hypothetical protein
MPGEDPRAAGGGGEVVGFYGFHTCTWVPNDIDSPRV